MQIMIVKRDGMPICARSNKASQTRHRW